MLTKTLSEAKKKQRNILIKAMNNDIGSIDTSKDSWNPAQISERAKNISYIRSLVDSWNPAQLNEALKMLDLPVIDTWNPAQIEEQRRNIIFYLAERTLTGNPITLNILGNLTPEVTGLKVTMKPIQSGSGDPSPTNIRPITGRTEASVTRTGKNLQELSFIGYWNNDGTKAELASSSYASAEIIPCKPSTTYTMSMSIDCVGYVIDYFDSNKNFITQIIQSPTPALSLSFTTRADAHFFGVTVRRSTSSSSLTDFPNYMLEEGNQSTAYEPYTAETKTHQYSETIYGGVDDFVNGGLSNEWGYIASYDGETLPGEWISDRDVYAPGTTPTAGAEVAYKLATPTTISTSAEEITLHKGTNVLSTDGDSIELKYKQNF